MKPVKGADYIYQGEGTAKGETFTVLSVSRRNETFRARMNDDGRLVTFSWDILIECEELLPRGF